MELTPVGEVIIVIFVGLTLLAWIVLIGTARYNDRKDGPPSW